MPEQTPRELTDRLINSLHVPKDAGENADGLRRILMRIPDGWGRWIGHRKGWYPLVIRLDEALAAVDPNYEIEQVKEKYGALRFYFCSEIDREDGRQQWQQMETLVEAAESESTKICEECGSRTDVRQRKFSYRIETLCELCAATYSSD